MLHCLIKLSDTLKLKHSLVRPAVSVRVPTAMTHSSQCGWRPRLSLGRQPIRTLCVGWKESYLQLTLVGCQKGSVLPEIHLRQFVVCISFCLGAYRRIRVDKLTS